MSIGVIERSPDIEVPDTVDDYPIYISKKLLSHIRCSTKVRTRFRTFASMKYNHASILLTNLLKS
jgi:hypothetical protein